MFSAEFEAKYHILQVIGEGGMGRVYLAEEKALQRKVAIKFLTATAEADALAVERFLQEARICAALKHPNIVPVFVSGTESGYPYMAFEFVQGQDLSHALAGGPLTAEEALRIARGVLSGLECAHAAGIIHRDLKPQNILLREPDAQPMIADFGMAKREDGSDVRTKGGLIVGTPLYMAPEQIRGQTLTPAVDLYAIGCTLYEMLTGRPPYLGENEVAILDAHLHRPAPRASAMVPGLPSDIDELVRIALEKSPQARFGSAQLMGEAVEALLDGRALPVTRPRLPSRPGAVSGAGMTKVGSRNDLARVSGAGSRNTMSLAAQGAPSRPGGQRVSSKSAVSRPSGRFLPQPGEANAPPRRTRMLLGMAIFVAGLAIAWGILPGAHPVARDVRVVLEPDGTATAEWSSSADAPGILQCVPEDGGPTVRAPSVKNQAGKLEARATGLAVGRNYRLELRHGKNAVWQGLGGAPVPQALAARFPAPGRVQIDLPVAAPPTAQLVRLSAGPVPVTTRTTGQIALDLGPGERVDDLALEWPLSAGLTARVRLPPAAGLAHRLADQLEKHDPRPVLVRLVTRRDYRVEAEDEGDERSGPREDWFGNRVEARPKSKRVPYLNVVRQELAAEPWLADLEAFRPLAKGFFGGAASPAADALRHRLYDALLSAEHYDLVVRSQRDRPEIGVREVYRPLVDHEQHLAAPVPDRRDTLLLSRSAGWGTADRAQWDVLVWWWKRFGDASLMDGLSDLTEARAREVVRPDAMASWEGVPAGREGETAVLTVTQVGLRPIYFIEVTFRSATGDPEAGKPFRVRFSYPPDGTGWMAIVKHDSQRGPDGHHGRVVNWISLTARFPARLLPRGKLAVRVSYEHLPGPTLKQLGIWHRTLWTRDVGIHLEP